jgi:hypothetical protein
MAGTPLVSPAGWALPGSYGVLSLDSASWQTLVGVIWLVMAGTVTTAGCQGRLIIPGQIPPALRSHTSLYYQLTARSC